MKKFFVLSLFAVSSVTMFGGNIEKKSKNNVSKTETVNQDETRTCYTFKVFVQKTHVPNPQIHLAFQETKAYTKKGALERSKAIALRYPNKPENKTLYTYEYLEVAQENCNITAGKSAEKSIK